ncbi:Ldh family oxidoreductase [Candidatus Poribacteria bacterium]
MPTIQHDALRRYVCQIFERSGTPSDEARIVSDHLVDANLAGHDSHGVLRSPGYASGMQKGVTPRAKHELVKESPTMATIDAHGGLGIVAALTAMEMAIDKARLHTFGVVGSYNMGHIGRLGDYPPRAAEEGMIGIALLNGVGRFVHPFGGVERRIPPNPLSIAVPRQNEAPAMLDITTCVVAGGKFNVKSARNEKLPEGWLIDSQGKPVTDPDRVRDDATAVPPLGGAQFGHKGFGLAFMVDAIAGGLTRAGCSKAPPNVGGNGFLAMVIKIDDFIPLDTYTQEVEGLIEWVKSSAKVPGVQEIYIPGEIEQRNRKRMLEEGIYIEDSTWNEMAKTARSLDVDLPVV